MFNYTHFQLSILNRYELCHFISTFKTVKVAIGYSSNLTIFLSPHLGHIILFFIGGDLLFNRGSPQMCIKIFINIILKIIKKLTQLFNVGGAYEEI